MQQDIKMRFCNQCKSHSSTVWDSDVRNRVLSETTPGFWKGRGRKDPPSGPNLHWDQLGRVAWCVEDVPGFLSLCVVPQHTTEARVC